MLTVIIISAQNAWLLATVFDDKGNYNYCSECIGAGKQRLARLRKVKVQRSLVPIVQIDKKEVLEKNLISQLSCNASRYRIVLCKVVGIC